MEDQTGDLEKDRRKRERKPKVGVSYNGPLTVMVVRGVGRVLRFEISPRILFWASLFLALYILASILVINRYFDLRRENKALSEEVTDARDQARTRSLRPSPPPRGLWHPMRDRPPRRLLPGSFGRRNHPLSPWWMSGT
ncbi:MAG: hypothetical protein JRH05_11550 [Deltaproteobacteria bacterium]|nr:hypothetical protein [Deltaproteobacteria bacterium]